MSQLLKAVLGRNPVEAVIGKRRAGGRYLWVPKS